MCDINENPVSVAALAYLGDSVFEVLVRERLVRSGVSDAGKLNRDSLLYVKATRQSEALERILPLFTEAEEATYRRARNMHSSPAPKSATVAEYRRATGLEAVFGMLFLNGEKERMEELFAAAFPCPEKNGAEKVSEEGSELEKKQTV